MPISQRVLRLRLRLNRLHLAQITRWGEHWQDQPRTNGGKFGPTIHLAPDTGGTSGAGNAPSLAADFTRWATAHTTPASFVADTQHWLTQHVPQVTWDLHGLPPASAHSIAATLLHYRERFPDAFATLTSVRMHDFTPTVDALAQVTTVPGSRGAQLALDLHPRYFTQAGAVEAVVQQRAAQGLGFATDHPLAEVITHELGHVTERWLEQTTSALFSLPGRYQTPESRVEYASSVQDLYQHWANTQQRSGNAPVSDYARTRSEWFAETFAAAQMGTASVQAKPAAQAMQRFLQGVFQQPLSPLLRTPAPPHGRFYPVFNRYGAAPRITPDQEQALITFLGGIDLPTTNLQFL